MDEYGQLRDLDPEGMQNLIEAIVHRAAEDWRDAMKVLQKDPDNIIADRHRMDSEIFFLSQHFYALTGLNGACVIEKLKEEFNAS